MRAMTASAEHPAVTPDSATEPGAERPVTEPARSRDSDPKLIEQRMQAALAAGTRTEASLSTLFRAVREMNDGLSGAREANELMVGELGTVRRMLRQATERNAELEAQLATMRVDHETALGLVAHLRVEAERDRAFLVEEQDRFLAALIEEHEETTTRLEARLRQAEAERGGSPPAPRDTAPSRRAVEHTPDTESLTRDLAEARRSIDRLVRERDRSRDVLRRLQAQRDEAQKALDMVGSRQDAIRTAPRVADADPPSPAPAVDGARDARKTDPLGPANARNLAATVATPPQGRSIFDRATAPPPAPDYHAPPADSHPTPPPELRAAITAAPISSHPTPAGPLAAITAPPVAPRAAPTATATRQPPLKQKPDPASRPIGGYSLQPEAAETVEAPRISSKPPRR